MKEYMLFTKMRKLLVLIALFLLFSLSAQASLVTSNAGVRRDVSKTGRIILNSSAQWFRLSEPGLSQAVRYIRASHESGHLHPATSAFTGREYEPELGLSFHRNRYYSPDTGRFISKDPVFGDLASPMSQHPYIYGNLSPYRFVDPMGEAAETPWDIFNIGLGITAIGLWNNETSFADKTLDVFGLGVDITAAAIPFVPGGAGVALKSMRAAKVMAGLNRTDSVLSGVSGLYASGSSMAEEGVGVGNAAGLAISALGISRTRASKNLRFADGISPIKPLSSALDVARTGGKHAGQYKQFLRQTPKQLNKSLASFKELTIKHQGWIENPTSKVPNWEMLRLGHRQDLLHHWQSDIARHKEFISIIEDMAGGL